MTKSKSKSKSKPRSIRRSKRRSVARKTPARRRTAAKKTVSHAGGSALGNIGAAAGSLIHPAAGHLGRFLGDKISKIWGEGDYHTNVEDIGHNVLLNGTTVPEFVNKHSDPHSTFIQKREYLGDITTGAGGAFNIQSYSLQPGLFSVFPFLSQIAPLYEEWTPHGIVFEYKSFSTDYASATNIGAVIGAVDYNSNDNPFPDRSTLENDDGSCSVKSSQNMLIGIECDPSKNVLGTQYIRSQPLTGNQDIKMYDLGIFYLATVGGPSSANIGSLYVSYVIELRKPKLPNPGFNIYGSHISRKTIPTDPASNLADFGQDAVFSAGSVLATADRNNIVFSGLNPLNKYMLTCVWDSRWYFSSLPAQSYTGNLLSYWTSTAGNASTLNNVAMGSTGGDTLYSQIVTLTCNAAGIIAVSTTGGNTVAASSSGSYGFDCFLTSLDGKITG